MHSYAVGQRWLSDTESELGLGVVIEVDARTVNILFPASDETRIYAIATAPLSRVVFTAGDTINDIDGISWHIAHVEQAEQLIKYHVTDTNDQSVHKVLAETRLGAHIQLSKPLEKLLAGKLDSKEWFELRIEGLSAKNKWDVSPLKGFIGPRLGLVPHQFYVAYEVAKRIAPRVLLADEVGLGKTIEAGLIIHQQLLTGRSERVLILVPEALQYQWMIELRRRFNMYFSILDLERTAAMREHDDSANPFGNEQLIIASIDLLIDHDDLKAQALEAGFDLLVVDEAHHLHWDGAQGGNAQYDVVADFCAVTPGVLLLTATPEQLGVESHFARLKLLDPLRFTTLDAFYADEAAYNQVAHIAQRLLGDEPLNEAEHAQLQALLGRRNLDTPEARQRALNELLDHHGTGRILFRNTREAVGGFPGRLCLPAPLTAPAHWPDTGTLKNQLWYEEQHLDGAWMESDGRVVWLMNILKNELKHSKVLLIARSGPVVESLDLALRTHAGIRSVVFHEQMSLLERDQAAAYFSDLETGAQILLCSEIGSEGRNFQFASDLILFDLPANADTLEQRIGRLDRIGQLNTIQIHVPYFMQTAQERLFRWYNEALNIFGQISPSAQQLQEQYLPTLKDFLLKDQGNAFDQLIEQINGERERLEYELQVGRDRLLEYNSCRPQVASRIIYALDEYERQYRLDDFLTRFMSATNIEYDVQRDQSIIIHPSSDILVDGLMIDEEGLTGIFARDHALVREDTHFITIEHPLIQSIFELFETQSFGNANVCLLRSTAIPEGTILTEFWFKVQAIAPKKLNINSVLTQQMIRVLLSEKGLDLSSKISISMLQPHLVNLDMGRARQLVKLKRAVIEKLSALCPEMIAPQVDQIRELAIKRYSEKFEHEITRYRDLQQANQSVRQQDIDQLVEMQQQGLASLAQLAIVPEAIRVMMAIKP